MKKPEKKTAGGKSLAPALRAQLQKLVDQHTQGGTAKRLACHPSVVAQALAGLGLRQGSLLLLETALAKLGEEPGKGVAA